MPAYSIKQITDIVRGKLQGNTDAVIKNLLTDSRNVVYPANSLFFAIKGERHNGHAFIYDLYNLGVHAFVISDIPANISNYSNAAFIIVENVLQALQDLAAYHRSQFKRPVVAITGSNGKTIIKEWMYQAMHTDKHVMRSPKSYNSQIGVPLSLWNLEPDHNIAIIEAGISLPGEMEKLEAMIRPDIGIFTNIGEPHQENFSNYQEKCNEKMHLFKNCKVLIYCRDHTYISNALNSDNYKHLKTITWSAKETADITVTSVKVNNSFTSITGNYNRQKFDFSIPFTDDASLENSLHLITFLLFQGYAMNTIAEKLKNLTPVAMRLELKHGINNCTIINDSYNSDLGSLAIALDYLDHQKQSPKKTLILSDILQSGRPMGELYKEVKSLITHKKVNRFIGIGPELSKQHDLFDASSQFFESTNEFIAAFRKDIFLNETILLKGSRAFEFERILKLLEKRVHETVLEININALVHNLNYFRSKLKPGVKLVAMVKAFSYGSGSFEIANILQFQRVDYLAVAFADEGVALREAGITLPIMVMNPEKSSFDTIIRNKFEPEIFSFAVLQDFTEAVKKAGITQFPVHLKLDSGMHRLGFMESEIDNLIVLLKNQNSLKIQSIFSHLAGSDEEQFDNFTNEQIKVFRFNSDKIIQAFPYKIMRHILNSAGIERFPDAQFDMVRLGIGLYGISALDATNVKNISTLKTVILQTKEVDKDESVGYSRKFLAKKPTRIGILPIGYADGLHRCLGNGVGKLLVNGKFVPIIGNICMDMCMIDITDIKAEEGDEVIVFGDNNPITEIAKQMNTIPYEVLTSISPRVKRIYYQE
jgi:alanine racemase